ncbi:MAG: CHASE3 domain-containing protein [Thauera sp.]|nr:CHASE3 domain-containing protein [Thauera sp.]
MQHADLTTSRPAMRRPALTAGLLLAGGLLLFILLAYSGYRSLQTVEHETLMRSRASIGLLHAGTVLSALKDIETGQRGYVLTGDEHYLGPFLAGRDALVPAFSALRAVATPSHATDLDALWALVLGRTELAQRNIDARRTEGAYTARFRALLDQGRTVMDEIRTRFDEVDAGLREEIVHRDKHLLELKRNAVMWAVVLTASGVVLIIIAYLLLQREQARRRRAEAALVDANTHLEDTVAARTAALDGVERGTETLRQIDALVAEGIATVRRIAAALRPPLLDDLGLGPALTLAGRQFGEHASVNCTVKVDDTDCLNPEQATQLYRITQEALTNIARHAGAQRVWIAGEVAHETEGNTYRLAIEDDGRGMAPSSTPENTASLGLVSMRERASLAGGSLRIGSGRDGGVRVEISLPLADSKEDATCAS